MNSVAQDEVSHIPSKMKSKVTVNPQVFVLLVHPFSIHRESVLLAGAANSSEPDMMSIFVIFPSGETAADNITLP
jgi:hypothetical protein